MATEPAIHVALERRRIWPVTWWLASVIARVAFTIESARVLRWAARVAMLGLRFRCPA